MDNSLLRAGPDHLIPTEVALLTGHRMILGSWCIIVFHSQRSHGALRWHKPTMTCAYIIGEGKVRKTELVSKASAGRPIVVAASQAVSQTSPDWPKRLWCRRRQICWAHLTGQRLRWWKLQERSNEAVKQVKLPSKPSADTFAVRQLRNYHRKASVCKIIHGLKAFENFDS